MSINAVSASLILAGVLLNAIAQLALKAGVRDHGPIALQLDGSWSTATRLIIDPYIWTGLICYVVSVIIWILALSRVDVSIAYPMLSLGYVVNAIAAWWLFGEVLGPGRLLGIGVIILGVFILARS